MSSAFLAWACPWAGTWYLAYRHADLFAAIAPICGWIDARPEFPVPAVPVGDQPALPALARQLTRMPVWIFHGERDAIVPVT